MIRFERRLTQPRWLDRFGHWLTRWTSWLFAAAIVLVGFHFLTFIPPDVANLFLPALGRVVDRHTSGEAEQERFYQISVSCEARNEALVRMQLLQRMGDNRLNLQSLESHALKGSGNVEVNAVVFTLHKEDSLVEQMVGELCLAPQVTAATPAPDRPREEPA